MSFKEENISTDLLIIGGGIAGLMAALETAKHNIQVAMVFEDAGASPGIMGFNVAIDKRDSNDVFLEDTIQSGCGLNNRGLVKTMVDEAEPVLMELESMGLVFDKRAGNYDQLQAVGCSYPRVVHCKNVTGPMSIKLMMEKIKRNSNIRVLKDITITGLLTEEDEIIGAWGINRPNNKFVIFETKALILATGGCGQTYSFTTYPPEAVGDGYAMAYEAGAELMDMEFIQFEPCVAVYPAQMRGFGVITTLLSEGGELRNIKGERFMDRYSPVAEKAQKDTLARAIYAEIQSGGGTKNGGIYFDVSMLPSENIEEKYPSYLNKFLSAGIDIRREPVEVAPAAHSCMGGVRINERCETSVKGLYSAGEVTGGLHGANRLGGNAGTETLVFGKQAGKCAAGYVGSKKKAGSVSKITSKNRREICKQFLNPNRDSTQNPNIIKSRIQHIMSEYANIVRDESGLEKALNDLTEIKNTMIPGMHANTIDELIETYQVKNMNITSEMVVRAALARAESRGAHYRKDFPRRNDEEWLKNIVIQKTNKGMKADVQSIG